VYTLPKKGIHVFVKFPTTGEQGPLHFCRYFVGSFKSLLVVLFPLVLILFTTHLDRSRLPSHHHSPPRVLVLFLAICLLSISEFLTFTSDPAVTQKSSSSAPLLVHSQQTALFPICCAHNCYRALEIKSVSRSAVAASSVWAVLELSEYSQFTVKRSRPLHTTPKMIDSGHLKAHCFNSSWNWACQDALLVWYDHIYTIDNGRPWDRCPMHCVVKLSRSHMSLAALRVSRTYHRSCHVQELSSPVPAKLTGMSFECFDRTNVGINYDSDLRLLRVFSPRGFKNE
jgi:hypothetical protein